eukprot:8546250-Pyramimonas_sp.AAC.2
MISRWCRSAYDAGVTKKWPPRLMRLAMRSSGTKNKTTLSWFATMSFRAPLDHCELPISPSSAPLAKKFVIVGCPWK